MFEIPDIQLNQYGKPARLMFLAPYAPDAPDFSKKPYTGNGGYPQYHYNIYKAIQDIGYDVVSSSKPYSVQFAKGNVDYVFSLMNRFAMSRPEIFISSYCEFIQVPYLGCLLYTSKMGFQNQAAILQSHILGSACISLLGSLVTDYSQLRFPLFGVYPGTVELVTPDINPPAGEGPRRFGIFSLYRHAKACSQQHGK